MNDEQVMKVSVWIPLRSNTYPSCLMPTLWQLAEPNLTMFPPPKKMIFCNPQEKTNQQLSVCFKLGNHTKEHASLWHPHIQITLQWTGWPFIVFPCSSGTQHQESHNCLTSDPLVAGTLQKRTNDSERKKEKATGWRNGMFPVQLESMSYVMGCYVLTSQALAGKGNEKCLIFVKQIPNIL